MTVPNLTVLRAASTHPAELRSIALPILMATRARSAKRSRNDYRTRDHRQDTAGTEHVARRPELVLDVRPRSKRRRRARSCVPPGEGASTVRAGRRAESGTRRLSGEEDTAGTRGRCAPSVQRRPRSLPAPSARKKARKGTGKKRGPYKKTRLKKRMARVRAHRKVEQQKMGGAPGGAGSSQGVLSPGPSAPAGGGGGGGRKRRKRLPARETAVAVDHMASRASSSRPTPVGDDEDEEPAFQVLVHQIIADVVRPPRTRGLAYTQEENERFLLFFLGHFIAMKRKVSACSAMLPLSLLLIIG